jgi:predicted site-specific integrase-resolvase
MQRKNEIQDDLVSDFVSIITSMVARIYGEGFLQS